MSDYGQSIPAKIFWDTSQRQLTRSAYAALVGKALVNVGMIFKPGVSSYDILDPANAEYTQGINTASMFFFDFPSTETFSINGVDYRPMLGMWYGTNNSLVSAGTGQPMSYFGFKVFTRRADRTAATDFRTYSYYRTGSTSALLGWAQGVTSGEAMSYESGASLLDNSWMPNATFGGTFAFTLKSVSNVWVYLGPGGLAVQIGTGPKKAEFGSLHSFVCPFGLGRIAGRGRIPEEDTNLNRICPVFLVPMITTDTEFIPLITDRYNDTTLYAELCAWTEGAQYALQYTSEPVRLRMYNLENVEQPCYPGYSPATLRSPRLVNGVSRHVMQQPAIIPWERRGATSELYSLIDFQINSDQPRPQWNDVFTCQNFRFGDRTMPVGFVEDPLTDIAWFSFWASNTNMMYAVNVEDYVDVTATTISPATPALAATVSYSLASAGFSSTFPTTTTITNTASIPWVATALTDEMTHVSTTTLAPANADIIFEIVTDVADIASAPMYYKIQFDARIRRVGGSGDLTGALQAFYTDFLGNVVTILSLTSTANSGDPNWNYVTYEATVLRELNGGNLKLTFRKQQTSSSFGTLTAGIRNISVRKYHR